MRSSTSAPVRAELVFEHSLGYTARPNNVCFAGTGLVAFRNDYHGSSQSPVFGRRAGDTHNSVEAPLIAYGCGNVIAVSNLEDPHSQRLLRGFSSPITCLDSSPMNTSSQSGPSVRVSDSLMRVIATGHAASPDGVCYVNLWDIDSGMLIKTIATPHKFVVTSVTNNSGGAGPVGGGYIVAIKFSPDGLLFATTGSDGSVCVMECAGGSRIGYYKDVIAQDEANAIHWSSVRNSGTRDQQYVFVVPFSTGVRSFSLQFNARTLSYEMSFQPFTTPGASGRMGGFQRKYVSIDQLGDDILCGCSNGELVVFNATTFNFRATFVVAHGAITGLAACPSKQCVFICASDGLVKRVVGRDAEWKIDCEVSLHQNRRDAHPLFQTRCVSMSINNGFHSQGETGGKVVDQLVITTSTGVIYRMLCSDMSFASAAEGPVRAVTALAVVGGGETVSSVVASCSADGAVRLWSLDSYETIGTYFCNIHHPESTNSNPAPFPNTHHHNNSNSSRQQACVGAGGNGFSNSNGGRALAGRFGKNDNSNFGGQGGSAVVTTLGYNNFVGGGSSFAGSSVSTSTIQGNNEGSTSVSAVPLCAVFDSHTTYESDNSAHPVRPCVLLTGWSDGHMRAIDFTACLEHYLGATDASRTQPTLSYEMTNTHKGPVVAIDACNEYLVTGGGDSVVRIWSNPPTRSPQQIVEQHNGVAPPNNGFQPARLPTSHHQSRTLLAEINAHRAPITGVRIDNASSALLHTLSADMSHKVFDLQSVTANVFGSNSETDRANPQHRQMNRGGMNHNNTNGNAINLTASHGGNSQGPRCIRSHDVPHCSGFLTMSQRADREHEIVVGTGDGQLLFFDIDVPTRPVASIVDKNKIPVVAVDVWSGNPTDQLSCMSHQRLAVGLGDGSILVYTLDLGTSASVASEQQQGVSLVFCAQGHSGSVTSVRWSPDGRQLYSAGAQGEFHIWNYFAA